MSDEDENNDLSDHCNDDMAIVDHEETISTGEGSQKSKPVRGKV